MNKGTPTVTEMQVIPVAGYDSMLMTLSGCTHRTLPETWLS